MKFYTINRQGKPLSHVKPLGLIPTELRKDRKYIICVNSVGDLCRVHGLYYNKDGDLHAKLDHDKQLPILEELKEIKEVSTFDNSEVPLLNNIDIKPYTLVTHLYEQYLGECQSGHPSREFPTVKIELSASLIRALHYGVYINPQYFSSTHFKRFHGDKYKVIHLEPEDPVGYEGNFLSKLRLAAYNKQDETRFRFQHIERGVWFFTLDFAISKDGNISILD